MGIPKVVDQFLACGPLEHGFARIRCDAAPTNTSSRSPVSAATSARVVTPIRRPLLGDLVRVAARVVTAAVRATTGESDLKVGLVACLQTHGSLANWHPHLPLVVTDGGFRPDGTFVRWPGWPSHDTLQLTEAFRRSDPTQAFTSTPVSGYQTMIVPSPCGWPAIAPAPPSRWSGRAPIP